MNSASDGRQSGIFEPVAKVVSDDHMWRRCALSIAIGIFLIFLVLVGEAEALSNSGGGSWSYSQDITIINPGAVLTDYQIMVNLIGAAFPTGAKVDGSDVRFTNSVGTELASWIEEWNSSAQKPKVWVNVTNIPSGASTVRIWWGNPGAGSTSNGTNTFLVYDHFDGGSLNTNIWSQTKADVSVANSILTFKSSPNYGWIKSISDYYGGIVTYYAKLTLPPQSHLQFIGFGDGWESSNSATGFYPNSNRNNVFASYNGSYISPYGANSSYTIGSYSRYTIKWSNTGSRYFQNDTEVLGSPIVFGNPTNSLHVLMTVDDYPLDIDYVYLRKFASPEPTVFAGSASEIEIAYDDGTWEGYSSMSPWGFGVHFTPSSNFIVNELKIDGIWISNTSISKNFDIEIWDKNLNTIYNTSYSYLEIFKENKSVWGWIPQNELIWGLMPVPSINAGNDFYVVLFDYDSREKNGIYVGCDKNLQENISHSKIVERNPNRISTFIPNGTNCNTMIRVTGYSDQVNHPLTVSISENPDPVTSGATSHVTVHVTTTGNVPVSGASISVSVNGGNLNPASGNTDVNGDFKTTYTAPAVTTSTTYTISATASKSGYTDGSGSDQITVNPPRREHNVLVVASFYKDEIKKNIDYYEKNLTNSLNETKLYYLKESFDNEFLNFSDIVYIQMPRNSSEYPDDEPLILWYSPSRKYMNDVKKELENKSYTLSNYDTILTYQSFQAVWSNNESYFRAFSYPDDKPPWVFLSISNSLDGTWGTFAHELGHAVFNLDDLYFDSNKQNRGDVGNWSIMGGGDDMNPPAPLISFDKERMRLLNYTIVKADELTNPMEYQLIPIENQTDNRNIIKIIGDGIILSPEYIMEARIRRPEINNSWIDHNGVVIYKDDNPKFSRKYFLEPLLSTNNPDEYHPTLDSDNLYSIDPNANLRFEYLGDSNPLDGVFEPIVRVTYDDKQNAGRIGASLTTFLGSVTGISSTSIINVTAPDLDLHAYTQDGKHIGKNYSSGIYENQINGSIASGDLHIKEWIFVPSNVSVDFKVSSYDVQKYLEEINKTNETFVTNYTLTNIQYDENATRLESHAAFDSILPNLTVDIATPIKFYLLKEVKDILNNKTTLIDQELKTSLVIVTGVYSDRYYASDGIGGLMVYTNQTPNVTMGDYGSLYGNVSLQFNDTAIVQSDFEKEGNTSTDIVKKNITTGQADSEYLENGSILVNTSGTVSEIGSDYASINDSSGAVRIFFKYGISKPSLKIGDRIIVTGVLTNGSIGILPSSQDSLVVQSEPDSQPASITNLTNTTYAPIFVNFTWLNPTDHDFSHVMLYLNGTFLTNVYSPQNYYNTTGLSPDNSYELGTHTVDTSGNVNQTWVNKTVRTAPMDGTPVVNFPGMTEPPTDTDGDDLFEDINGNGWKDFNDVVVLFKYLEWVAGNQPISSFDFNGNGRIDFNDIIKLFEET